MRLRVFFSFQVRLHRSKRAPVRRSAPSVPGRAVAGIFSFQVRLGRRKHAPARRSAHLPCPGGRLRVFFFAPSSAWSEKACAGASMRAFRARAGGCGAVFRSKFGLVGESMRRCAEAHLPCPGGRLRGCFSLQVRLHRRKRAPVRRCAPSVPGRGRLRGCFPLQVRLGRSKRAPARRSAPSVPGRAIAGIFSALRHVLKVLSFRT